MGRVFYIPILAYIIAFGYTFYGYDEGVNAHKDTMVRLEVVNGSYIDLINIDIAHLREERAFLASSEYALITLFIEAQKDSRVPSSMVDEMVRAVLIASEAHDVPSAVILGVIDTESDFVPWAVSTASCRGLMQLNPFVWKLDSEADYYDIETNIMEGTRILRHYVNLFGWDYGISAYNMGSGNTNKGKFNADYVTKVLESTEKFRRLL